MDKTLKEQLVHALRGLKRATMTFPPGLDLHMGEMMMMSAIARKAMSLGRPVNVSDLQEDGRMTKPAVSQLLNALEGKGYVGREIDRSDRRKITVTLTDHGWKTLHLARSSMDRELEKVVSRLGEDETRKLIELLLSLRQITEDIRREAQLTENKGDNPFD
ncbi:MAG: MarR family winged helix-turn-helix transcriptional regulator [Bacillota bacterium]